MLDQFSCPYSLSLLMLFFNVSFWMRSWGWPEKDPLVTDHRSSMLSLKELQEGKMDVVQDVAVAVDK